MSQPGHREVHSSSGEYSVLRRLVGVALETVPVDIREAGWADACPWLGGTALHTAVQARAAAVVKRVAIKIRRPTLADDNFRAGFRTGDLVEDEGGLLTLVWPSGAKEHVFRVQPQLADQILLLRVDFDVDADAPGTV